MNDEWSFMDDSEGLHWWYHKLLLRQYYRMNPNFPIIGYLRTEVFVTHPDNELYNDGRCNLSCVIGKIKSDVNDAFLQDDEQFLLFLDTAHYAFLEFGRIRDEDVLMMKNFLTDAYNRKIVQPRKARERANEDTAAYPWQLHFELKGRVPQLPPCIWDIIQGYTEQQYDKEMRRLSGVKHFAGIKGNTVWPYKKKEPKVFPVSVENWVRIIERLPSGNKVFLFSKE